MNRAKPIMLASAALFVVLLPIDARASDTTGAFVHILGLGLIAITVFCIVLAFVLKFAFKCGHWVWGLILVVPVSAIVLPLLVQFFSRIYDDYYHAGPHLESNGSHSVTVSPDYGKKELERALALINAPSFKSELARYTDEPLSNYVFSVDLWPGNRKARRSVTICVQPKIEVNTPVYEGIMYLFTKAVV